MLSHLDSLRFPYESKLFMQVQMNPGISNVLDSVSRKRDRNFIKRHLLGSAVKITAALIPELYQLYQTCLNLVGEGLQGDLYVQQQSDYNAWVSAAEKRFDIVLASGIVNDFRKEEIAFVIGHELGHVLFEHNKIPVNFILAESDRYTLSYELANLLFQWSRATEISADRIGLLCSGSLASAARAFFKTSSGLLLDREEEIIRSLRHQYDEIATLSKSSGLGRESFYTHPLIPIRFKSLELICLDIMALRSQGSKVKVSWSGIDSEIEEVLLKTEPLGKQNLKLSPGAIALSILSLVYVAVSDGELNQYEEYFIRDIQQRVAPDLNLPEILSVCKRDRRKFSQQALSDLRSSKISADDVEKIVQLCYTMAIADNPICQAEIQAMETLCKTLGCNSSLVKTVISRQKDISS